MMIRTILALAISFASTLAFTGCVTQPEPAADNAAPAVDRGDLEGEATLAAALTTPADTNAIPTCFTCELDESIRTCSTNTSRALQLCTRACVVCDVFAGHTDCFQGSCEVDPRLVASDSH